MATAFGKSTHAGRGAALLGFSREGHVVCGAGPDGDRVAASDVARADEESYGAGGERTRRALLGEGDRQVEMSLRVCPQRGDRERRVGRLREHRIRRHAGKRTMQGRARQLVRRAPGLARGLAPCLGPSMISSVDDRRGGKLTLRLVSFDGAAAEYTGELASGGEVSAVGIRVDASGQVDVKAANGAPPDWLVATTRSMMRAAWRSAVAGTPWPRRLSRWRPAAEDGKSEP
jgi:hypothetical protein